VAGAGGAGGAAGAPSYPLSCSTTPGPTFATPSFGILRALWWKGGWLLLSYQYVFQIGSDGAALIPFKRYYDTTVESVVQPSIALTAVGPLIAYSGTTVADNLVHARLALLDDQLAVKSGPVSIGAASSGMAGLSPDGRAVAWGQYWNSGAEGYRFSRLDSTLTLAGATDTISTTLPSTYDAQISPGASGSYVFYRAGCTSAQRYDTAGNRVGTATLLKPDDKSCPDDTNAYAQRATGASAFASGVHFAAFTEFGINTRAPWIGYAVVDDATGRTLAVRALSKNDNGTSFDYPTVATFDGRFGLAWGNDKTGTTGQRNFYFVLIGADGAQLSPILALGTFSGKGSIALGTAPTGFVVFTAVSLDTTYTMANITCR
jgi:hypothetical protein